MVKSKSSVQRVFYMSRCLGRDEDERGRTKPHEINHDPPRGARNIIISDASSLKVMYHRNLIAVQRATKVVARFGMSRKVFHMPGVACFSEWSDGSADLGQIRVEESIMENLNNENSNNDSSPEKNLVSDRKREANRQNAQKSTGPRSERGKNHSARNAITHGLYAKNANFVLSQESKEEFSDLCLRFHFDLMPIGAVEELEVERMAMLHWKLQRLWRFENGLIGLATHTVFKRQVRDEMQPTVAELSSQQSNRAKVMDADVSTSSAPEGTLVGADTRSIQKLLRDAEFCNVAEAQLDAEAVPHALYLDIIHRAQSATEKGLNDALKRFKSLRKFRLTTRLADDQLSFAQATYHEDGSVTI